jgi:hypothetical protein
MKTTQVRAIGMDPGDALFSIPTRCTPSGPKTTPITAATSCFRATTGLITPRTRADLISATLRSSKYRTKTSRVTRENPSTGTGAAFISLSSLLAD